MFVKALRAHPRFSLVSEALRGHVDLEQIERGFDLGWLELSVHNVMTTIVGKTLGEMELLELWRATFGRSLQKRFLAQFVEFISPLAGGDLVPIARRAPVVYTYLARACGTMSWEDQPDGGLLRLRDFPAEYTFRPWLICNLGSLQAAAKFLGGDHDKVQLRDIDERARSAVFAVRS